jgi:uncharacterized protein YuzE
MNLEHDIGYIRLVDIPAGAAVKSQREHDVVFDFDINGRLIGIELLRLSQYQEP